MTFNKRTELSSVWGHVLLAPYTAEILFNPFIRDRLVYPQLLNRAFPWATLLMRKLRKLESAKSAVSFYGFINYLLFIVIKRFFNAQSGCITSWLSNFT